MRCAVIGSTGYVGVRLVARLLDAGHEVTALVRTPAKLASTGWADRVEVVRGDLADPEAVSALLRVGGGADVVHHLAHALGRTDFPERDRLAARRVADAAAAAGVRRIVYLGGLRPPPGERPSRHLGSRADVADLFLGSPVPTAALEASIVVGSGSASFEMIRYLAERLPVVPAVPWTANRTQPVAVDDVLHYLVACADLPADVDRRFDVGGPDVLTYLDLMQRYVRLAGLPQRPAVPLPVPVPPGGSALAALVVEALTPLPRHLVQPLIESLAHELVCGEDDIVEVAGAPPGGSTTYDAAVRAALGRRPDGRDPSQASPSEITGPPEVTGPSEVTGPPETDRDGARAAAAALASPADAAGSGGPVYRWGTAEPSTAPADALWTVVDGIGGPEGWYTPPGVWAARGWVDQLLGGPGAYRGRPHGRALRIGDVVDGWRVEALEPGTLLRLRSELRLPGRLWLDLRVEPDGTGSRLRLEVTFGPAGLAGIAYGTALRAGAPLVFGTMARGMALRAS